MRLARHGRCCYAGKVALPRLAITLERTTSPVRTGDILAGKYRVERVLGAGGMGVVVAAEHLQLDARVALKFMTPEMLEDREAVTRFLREARAAARLKGEHVTRVSDVGTLDNDAPYLVMEYLEGEDLGQLIQRSGPQGVAESVEYIRQACEAIDEAHAQGIVHRDLKPSNLFLTRRPNGRPCIKVLDFGISKLAGQTGVAMNMTNTRAVFGSPTYMAPEQMRSARDVDHRADIWSLGATLFELLTGRVPFEAESIMELCLKVAQENPPPPSSVRIGLPSALDAVVLKCLEKDINRRYVSASELSAALAPFASALSTPFAESTGSLTPVQSSKAAEAVGQASDLNALSSGTANASRTGTTWGTTGKTSNGSSKTVLIATIAVLIAAVSGLGIWIFVGSASQSDEARPAAATPPQREPTAAAAAVPVPSPVKVAPVLTAALSASSAIAPVASATAADPSQNAPSKAAVHRPAARPAHSTTTKSRSHTASSDPFANPD